MSREKAIQLLDAAKMALDTPGSEAIDTTMRLIASARAQLRTAKDEDPIEYLKLAVGMITDHLMVASQNIPAPTDEPDEKTRKYSILESEFLVIQEYAKGALKCRQMGSGTVATELTEGVRR